MYRGYSAHRGQMKTAVSSGAGVPGGGGKLGMGAGNRAKILCKSIEHIFTHPQKDHNPVDCIALGKRCAKYKESRIPVSPKKWVLSRMQGIKKNSEKTHVTSSSGCKFKGCGKKGRNIKSFP